MHPIPAKSTVRILEAAARRGVGAAVACAAADIDPATLTDPDYRLSFARVVRLYDACARLSGDASFGLHVGEQAQAAAFDAVAFVTMGSRSLGDALRQLERYHRLWTDGAALSTAVDGGRVWIEYRYDIEDPRAEGRRQDCEAMLTRILTNLRALVAPTLVPQRVWCEHEAPADTSEHSRVFRCPIEFGQPSNALVLDAGVLEHEIPRVDAVLSATLDRHARDVLASRPVHDSQADRVREVLVTALRGGDPDLASVAAALDVSTRTLQRRLQDEGTSLQDVIDEVRRDLCAQYFRRQDLTIADVSYLLGFSEPATFHRACRRWMGMTAGEFRRRLP